ncbi:dihydroneopterin aldolase [Comamonas avium]|uniref:Dihydroneopterin aldolase n=1 Tax=Comamonas avium TaxID=2762231 RepID=A0ABR8S9W4_9BURK|nr:dihydroneopterin aldolase [Comamonas avium]MBD7960273.1 dihydroneopterin aldolase [Comamonas avium]
MSSVATGQRTISLTGLRLNARLGILDFELEAAQPICVDAQLNMGVQPLLPASDDISEVLDYRLARNTIISTCTAGHTDLLERLTGTLAQQLMALPGVQGVRVKITKLEIFDDCEVAIRVETGQW